VTIERPSPCKVNLLLNILGRRADGFHELETLMQPVALYDRLTAARAAAGIALSCSEPALPVDGSNLVHRAAAAFLAAAKISDGVALHLEKHIPMAAGLGGGSGNAATTLLALNELFGHPLPPETLHALAATLGSDVPFFLQGGPALAGGRGERVEPVARFDVLDGRWLLLIHPGFGVSTAWAYSALANFPDALNGRPGRARALASQLAAGDYPGACGALYNSLEAPVLAKHPVLALTQEFLRGNGADAALMSGSGSTTFALMPDRATGERALEAYRARFGAAAWTALVPVNG
jgi:4-diphosphocytidyl-2-C-methyl-D-erythritol kinase